MKLNPLASLFACSALLSFSLWAAPTDVHRIDFNDEHTQAVITQDENEMTQVTVEVKGKQYEFTFTPAEMRDNEALKAKLATLPEPSQQKVLNLLTRLDGKGIKRVRVIHSKLSPQQQEKLAELSRKMAKKEAELAKHTAKIEAKIASKSAEMELKRAEMEAKAKELEQKAMEFEVFFDEHDVEFDRQIDVITSEIADIAGEMAMIDGQFTEVDGEHFIVISEGAEQHQISHILSLIEAAHLSDEQKQQLRQALDEDNRK